MDKWENEKKTSSEEKQNEELTEQQNDEVWKVQTASLTCPNCGSTLEGRKCKLLCPRPGCGYMVTCSEW